MVVVVDGGFTSVYKQFVYKQVIAQKISEGNPISLFLYGILYFANLRRMNSARLIWLAFAASFIFFFSVADK